MLRRRFLSNSQLRNTEPIGLFCAIRTATSQRRASDSRKRTNEKLIANVAPRKKRSPVSPPVSAASPSIRATSTIYISPAVMQLMHNGSPKQKERVEKRFLTIEESERVHAIKETVAENVHTPEIVNSVLVKNAFSKVNRRRARGKSNHDDLRGTRLVKPGCYVGFVENVGTHFVGKAASPPLLPSRWSPSYTVSDNLLVNKVLDFTEAIAKKNTKQAPFSHWKDMYVPKRSQLDISETQFTLRPIRKQLKPIPYGGAETMTGINSEAPEGEAPDTVLDSDVIDSLKSNELTVQDIMSSSNWLSPDPLKEARGVLTARRRQMMLELQTRELEHLETINKRAQESTRPNKRKVHYTSDNYAFSVDPDFVTTPVDQQPDLIEAENTVKQNYFGRTFKMFSEGQSDMLRKVREVGDRIRRGEHVLDIVDDVAPHNRIVPTKEMNDKIKRLGEASKLQLRLMAEPSPPSEVSDRLWDEASACDLFKSGSKMPTDTMPPSFTSATMKELELRNSDHILAMAPTIEAMNGLFHFQGPPRISNHPITAARVTPKRNTSREITVGLIISSLEREAECKARKEGVLVQSDHCGRLITTAAEALDRNQIDRKFVTPYFFSRYLKQDAMDRGETFVEDDEDEDENTDFGEDSVDIRGGDFSNPDTPYNKAHGERAIMRQDREILCLRSKNIYARAPARPDQLVYQDFKGTQSSSQLRRDASLQATQDQQFVGFSIDLKKVLSYTDKKPRRSKRSFTE